MLAARQHECRPLSEVSAAAQKSVLFQLADRALPDGTIYPTSVRQLARWTQYTRKSVQRIQEALLTTGDLVLITEAGTSTVALLRLGVWYEPEPADAEGASGRRRGGVGSTQGGASGRRPNDLGRRSTTKSKALSATEARLRDEQERAEATARALFPQAFSADSPPAPPAAAKGRRRPATKKGG